MTDDGSAPTIPDTQAPTHGSSLPGGAPGTPDPRYGLRTLLGKGGMGEVWLAHDGRVDREIAIKLMRGTSDPESVARFLREARVQGRLEHPSVVPVHDLGTEPGTPFFAMKRLTGTTLAEVLHSADARNTIPRRTLLTRFVDICLAIQFAHERGVIHRDLKPANIMLGDYGEAYVLDWGLARIAGDSGDAGVIRRSDLKDDASSGQTEAGAMLGTPGYMAPEQVRGEPVDVRADIFSLGCILFEILAGTPAVPRDRALEVTLASACYRPSERVADVPPELDASCAKATAANRDDRHASARALADEVQRFLDGDRDLERRRQLSAEHTDRAQQLLAKDDIDSRAEAMREVGSAIALDAGNRIAHAMLMRLLLEPPKTLPPEVRRKIDDDRQKAFLPVLRGMSIVYTIAVILVFVVRGSGVSRQWSLVLLVLENGGMAVFLVAALIRRWRISVGLFALGAALHASIMATVGIGLGPLLLLPIVLFGSLPIMLVAPIVRAPRIVFGVHVVAFGLPLVLEWLHVVPRSFYLVGHSLVLEPPVALSASSILVAVISMVLLQLIGVTIVLAGQRREQDRAQELVHLQSWQLAQLVRSSGSTP
ncbi:MAG TPA: serine/threonine-protein kinase [Kofleriaceae bacterium]|nr:serine/threonine-protein kinase [Kofleriaceae bacterium]